MATTLTYRDILDFPEWRSLSQAYGHSSSATATASAGTCIAEDYRCRDYASPLFFFQGATANYLAYYNTKMDAWGVRNTTMGMGGTFGAGATSVFCPTFSPNGTLAAGGTVNKVTLSTALPASVVTGQLANRGDTLGFIVRIIGNAAGSSGKIEERRVIANTSGTTPTIYFDQPLSFVPALGDRYEFLSGSVLFLNTGVLAANQFRRYDILTNSFFSLSTTNLIATVPTTHNQLIVTDEQYVPADRNPGEGYIVGAATYDASGQWVKSCLTATASAAGTITGQASSGDSAIVANQFRNFQIRIVEDTTNVTAVGQRRRITSHTAGASPVYTLNANWTITPSSTCKFVIEHCTDNLIGFMGGTTTIYNYKLNDYLGNTANVWDAGTTWTARAATIAQGGITWHAFGIPCKTGLEGVRSPGEIISMRGAGLLYDRFDVTGGATGAWTNGVSLIMGNVGFEIITSAGDYCSFAYNPHTQDGRYVYFIPLGTGGTATIQRPAIRIDSVSGLVEMLGGPKQVSGSTSPGYNNAAFTSVFQDGTTKIAFWSCPRPLSGNADYIQLMLVR